MPLIDQWYHLSMDIEFIYYDLPFGFQFCIDISWYGEKDVDARYISPDSHFTVAIGEGPRTGGALYWEENAPDLPSLRQSLQNAVDFIQKIKTMTEAEILQLPVQQYREVAEGEMEPYWAPIDPADLKY